MTVFHADLDNTLIYSCRHEIGREKTNVELYEGRQVSFMTEASSRLLRKVREKAVFVPVTTRTREQYDRIDLKTGVPDYALVCNGGVLLKQDEEISEWYEESLRMIKGSRREFRRAMDYMREDRDRLLEVRNIRDLFLFTKSSCPLKSAEHMRERLDLSLVNIFTNGTKVYVLPKGLDKGTAVRRFREYIKADRVIAAGDSVFDVPMLREADLAYAPERLKAEALPEGHVKGVPESELFSDVLLRGVLAALSDCEKRMI